MTRVLGIDLGTRRIGLAISDPSRTLASPLRVLERGIDHAHDHRAILDVAREHGVDRLVVGWPRSLSGRDGPAALAVREEVAELEAAGRGEITVALHDERFSTATATERLRAAGRRADRSDARRSGRRRSGSGGRGRRAERAPVDAAAAAVFLQAYLDALGPDPARPEFAGPDAPGTDAPGSDAAGLDPAGRARSGVAAAGREQSGARERR